MTRSPLRWTALATLTLLLAGCSTSPPSPPTTDATAASSAGNTQVVRIALAADATPDQVATPGTQLLAWHPEEGFALVVRSQSSGLSAQGGTSGEANANRFAPPEVQGSSVWAGGRTAWSGGNGSASWQKLTGNLKAASENKVSWKQINLVDAWSHAPKLGQGIKVAVIDTGIDLNHPAFLGNLAPASEWKDFVDGDSTPQEVKGTAYGHGTGVAGVILQIAPKAILLPIRVLRPDGSGDVSTVVQAMDWAMKKGARVINLSLGSDTPSPALNDMLRLAASRKVMVVASSGNSGDEKITYPAGNESKLLFIPIPNSYLISVGSVDANDVKSSFSTYGMSLNLTAPGERIYTAMPDNGAGYWSGTSFAAPMATGALALALAENGTNFLTGFLTGPLTTLLSSDGKNIDGVNFSAYRNMLGKRLDLAAFLKDTF
ncbi:S8 family serine peptidase [Deinococcus sp. AJ005]|uniref:S8 family peptidase n=1 Tax=Deinococcus sp. AJ005 TaxID=2652443 RepID=UPI00125CB566|nr:S8 family serine peptidase [Deinococcus sp. AJ005]QFP76403.1 S8 family serine peptidase [Deinococcus sp. AJ005]